MGTNSGHRHRAQRHSRTATPPQGALQGRQARTTFPGTLQAMQRGKSAPVGQPAPRTAGDSPRRQHTLPRRRLPRHPPRPHDRRTHPIVARGLTADGGRPRPRRRGRTGLTYAEANAGAYSTVGTVFTIVAQRTGIQGYTGNRLQPALAVVDTFLHSLKASSSRNSINN